MKNNDTIEYNLTQIVRLLEDIKSLLEEQKTNKESRLPRQI